MGDKWRAGERRIGLRVAAALALLAGGVVGGTAVAFATSSAPAQERREQWRDFDFEFGAWRTRLRRLAKPLSGTTAWLEYEGISRVTPLLAGRANVVELDVTGAAGTIRGLSLRLYEPATREWTLNFANMASGELVEPMRGSFRDGRGEFYAVERFGDRRVLVRFVITAPSKDSLQFEQAFSIDGGRSWEVNWLAVDTRLDLAPDSVRRRLSATQHSR